MRPPYTVCAAAVALVRRRFPVFPIHGITMRNGSLRCACGKDCGRDAGKHPIGRLAPNGKNDATLDERQVVRWFKETSHNLAVRPDGLVVIDVDPRKGGDASLRDLEAQHGELPVTWHVLTGGGGSHYYFREPMGVAIKCKNDGLAPGVDIKTRDGYLVAPPSLHLSGEYYAWSVDGFPGEVELAPLPQWIVSALREPEGGELKPKDWTAVVGRDIPDGERNETMASVVGHLMRKGVDPAIMWDLLEAYDAMRFKPPLGSRRLQDTIRSIGRKEADRRERHGLF